MPSNHTIDNQDVLRSPVSGFSGILRVVLGLIQGLLLYVLYYSTTEKTWLSTQAPLFVALVMLAGFLPLAAISAIGHLPTRKLLIWLGVLAVVLGGLGYYDGWRTDVSQLLPAVSAGSAAGRHDGSPSGTLFLLTVTGLFIAQAMVLAGNADNKRIASYPSYFEIAWKLLVQLLFAALFTGLFWLVLETGDALFSLIKLDFLDALINKSWFHIPATTLALSFALHLSDVRPHIVAGIRKLLLSLLSWLLPMATLIVAGFLLSILATGLEPLWQTRWASQVLLGATGLLVVLINTVYQDGNRLGGTAQRFFALCARIACLLPTPLVLLAMYSLGLRVEEYGWTVSRITGAVCALIAAFYALGYGIAAIRLRHHFQQISTTNVAAGFAILAVFIALLSPLADPARLAVLSQVQRLENGKVEPERFDYRFLRFAGDRYGVMQLKRLSEQQDGAHADLIREKAKLALAAKNNWGSERFDGVVAVDLTKNIRMHPVGRQLPQQFAKQDWRDSPEHWNQPGCLTRPTQLCDAYIVKPDPTGSEQVLIFENGVPSLFVPGDAGNWQFAGKLIPTPACSERLRQAAEQGTLKWQAPLQKDLDIDGLRLRLDTGQQANVDCAKAGGK